MRLGPPANKLPEHKRYVPRAQIFKTIQREYPNITNEEIQTAIEINLIRERIKVYSYDRGFYLGTRDKKGKPIRKIIKQIDRRYNLGDALKWAKTRGDIE